jgi:hypothetical protein
MKMIDSSGLTIQPNGTVVLRQLFDESGKNGMSFDRVRGDQEEYTRDWTRPVVPAPATNFKRNDVSLSEIGLNSIFNI